MQRFKGHYPIGIVRTCKGSMTLTQQRWVLRAAGVSTIWRLGIEPLEEVMRTFHRRTQEGKPEPTVLVTPIPAVVGNDRRDIFETLAKLGQSLYDLELDRFIDLRGAEDIILYERSCHKQRADHARTKVKNPGRKSLLDDDEWKTLSMTWCSSEYARFTNDAVAEQFGISPAAIINKFGGRKLCIAAGKPVK